MHLNERCPVVGRLSDTVIAGCCSQLILAGYLQLQFTLNALAAAVIVITRDIMLGLVQYRRIFWNC